MSTLNHTPASLMQSNACGTATQLTNTIRSPQEKRLWTIACGLLLALGMLTSCSEDKPRSPDSELLVDRPEETIEDGAPAPPTPTTTDAAEPEGPLTGVGRRYRVAVGTAYFFDAPQQSTPNGRYLRRGDVFYGEGEHNGFVKTGFEAPNGVKSTGWLKKQELVALAGSAAPKATRSASPRPAAAPRPAAPPAAPAESEEATPTPAAPRPRAAPVPAGAETAVVQVAKSYFYDSPDLSTPRKAHCIRGDKVRLGETRGDAVYVTFTNWQNVTSTGWMKRDALSTSR